MIGYMPLRKNIILILISEIKGAKMFYRKIIVLTVSLLLYSTISSANHTPTTKVIEKVMPAVVEIIAENNSAVPASGGFKFRQKGGPNKFEGSERTRSGSGFVISEKGLVITNAHVIANITNKRGIVHLRFKNGKQYNADVIGYDTESDIAVLKINNPKNIQFPFVVWGETPEIGSQSIAIGSPMGLSFTTTFGYISALDRMVPNTPNYVPFIQTDTSINPGNSGGPLFDDHGNVVGINTMVMSNNKGGGSIGLGFAIDGDYAQYIIKRLKAGEKIERPYIGVLFRQINKKDIVNFEKKYGSLTTAFRYPESGTGIFIEEIIQKGPSDGILKAGDILLELDGVEIHPESFAKIVVRKLPKDNVVLKVLRAGKTMIANVTLGYRTLKK